MSGKNRQVWRNSRGALGVTAAAGLIALGTTLPNLAQDGDGPPVPVPPAAALKEGTPPQGSESGDDAKSGEEASLAGSFGAVNTGLSLVSVHVVSQDLNDRNKEYVQFTFSRPVSAVSDADSFTLAGYGIAAAIPSQDARIVRGDPTSVLTGYPVGTDVMSYTVAQVPVGAVTDESGRTNLPSTVALEGGNVTTGAAAMPKLVAVEANNTLNQVTYRFDRNLDTEAAQASQLGFYTLDGRAVTAASIVSGDNNKVIAQFDRQVQDAARYFADAGAVTDSRGIKNAPNSTGEATAAPQLSAVSALIGRTQFEYTFTQPVAEVTAANFTVYTPDGAEIAGASALQPSPNVVRVAFPAIEKYGQTVTVAAVKFDAVKSNDGSATANTVGLQSAGEGAGLTSGPDLQSVTMEASTGQVRYIFDEVLDDDKTYDPANFALITAAGDIVPARSFVEVDGNSILLNFNAAAAHAAHAVTVSGNAVQDFQGNANPLGTTTL